MQKRNLFYRKPSEPETKMLRLLSSGPFEALVTANNIIPVLIVSTCRGTWMCTRTCRGSN